MGLHGLPRLRVLRASRRLLTGSERHPPFVSAEVGHNGRTVKRPRRIWPTALTVLVAAHAIHTALNSTPIQAANIGNFVAGYASALAFIWLVAGYLQQGEELALQRDELRAQREALTLQKEEMHRVSETGALGQVAILLEDFRRRLPEHVEGVDTFEDIHRLLWTETGGLHKVLDIRYTHESGDIWKSWIKAEAISRRFLDVVRGGALLYARSAGDVWLRDAEPVEQFILTNETEMVRIPHIGEAMWSARAIATVLVEFADIIRRGGAMGERAIGANPPDTPSGYEVAPVSRRRVAGIERSLVLESDDRAFLMAIEGDRQRRVGCSLCIRRSKGKPEQTHEFERRVFPGSSHEIIEVVELRGVPGAYYHRQNKTAWTSGGAEVVCLGCRRDEGGVRRVYSLWTGMETRPDDPDG